MCGIVGILGREPVAPLIVDALKRLEYRGYDSAGVATLEAGELTRRRAQGKLVNLEARLRSEPLSGLSGIGHTRWATHGKPTEANAHPHATDRVAVVHNGIIENYQALRAEIRAAGRTLSSETDTEVIVHLITMALDRGMKPVQAMSETLTKLQGAFALAVLFAGEDDMLVAARRGSPLAIGHGDGEMFLGSDAIALAPFTNSITYLEDGDWAVVTRRSVQIFDEAGTLVSRPMTRSVAASLTVDKGNHRHFMLKEIYEQPEVISHTFGHYLDFAESRAELPEGAGIDFTTVERLSVSACGTAYYAGLIGKYWFERLARMPVEIDVASEFRYREMPLKPGGLSLFISQSGETADTLASLRYCRQAGQRIAAIVNVPTSTIAREADFVLPTMAGPEIGVASTKAFTCQLSVLFSLAIAAGRQRGFLSEADERRLVQAAVELPRLAAHALKLEGRIERLAKELSKAKDVLYLGRGTSFPLALEGALKLKEISYIHAEGYAAGELKHGPIALIDETLPVIVIAPFDALFEKTVSNMQEVAARGGRIILITDEKGAAHASLETMETLVLPDVAPEIAPLVYSIPVQLIAYHTAVFMGTDVDQPRNLAKSVTVE
ncbi:glutamine--fructose-6-phosphate transaminase [Faunimonas pinastri]|uniref:Glutamine--fructose-6-phosphate aminotransferase [isomerizing] n=1 Tax=Faunimonas pinastri TaxID=1855383 RepID=A0A1H9JIG3_9HYPH|nr:glutamine--fructose-6-phosphate transaminase (isomerizing) [Faunimonas pinastri]SEQ86610.1 glutamine--fructose-6-phosphate transaminase [Faunimonas pinastri]